MSCTGTGSTGLFNAADIAGFGVMLPDLEPVTMYSRDKNDNLSSGLLLPLVRREPAKLEVVISLQLSADTKTLCWTVYDQNVAYKGTPYEPKEHYLFLDQDNQWWLIRKIDVMVLGVYYYCTCTWMPPSTTSSTP